MFMAQKGNKLKHNDIEGIRGFEMVSKGLTKFSLDLKEFVLNQM
jgi:hypothetical protein